MSLCRRLYGIERLLVLINKLFKFGAVRLFKILWINIDFK